MISVVLPVRNMDGTLEVQLEALYGQDYSGDWELILVDNGSGDETASVARRWQELLPLRVISAGDPPDMSRARNIGVAAAGAELLAFCDGDDAVCTGWLTAMVRALQDAPLVAGPLDYQRFNSATAAAALDEEAPAGPAWSRAEFGGGCSLGVRRSVYQDVGGFPEGYGRGEDMVFNLMAQLAGHRLRIEPAALVHYRLKGDSRRAMFWMYYRRGRSSARRYHRFRDHGMPRSPTRDVVYDWASIPVLWLRGNTYRAAQMAGWRLGRLVGSARSRVLYL